MQIILPNSDFDFPPIAVSIGFYDGLHKGHQFLLNNLKAEAAKRNMASAVITFANHPRQVIEPDFQMEMLSSVDEKLKLIEQSGIDYCIILNFNEGLKNLSAFDFMKVVLKERYNTGLLIIGYDHRFGKNREETFDDYVSYGKSLGIEVINNECFAPEGLHISSSAVRKAIMHGDIEDANQMLGRIYSITGDVVSGKKLGRQIGFPTANILLNDKSRIFPKKGVYAVYTEIDGQLYPAMANIGHRPTVEESGDKNLEVHIIDFEGDLYKKSINVYFLKYLRDEIKMNSLEDLKNQLSMDKQNALLCFNKFMETKS